MINREFNAGILELKDIFPRFKLTNEQEKAWFLKLRHFSNLAMLGAVKWLCDRDELPTFHRLKLALGLNQERSGQNKTEIQGMAPKGAEFDDFVGSHMAGLRLMMAEKNRAKREKMKAELLKTWNEGYKHLPGYKSESEVRRLTIGKEVTTLRIRQDGKGQAWVKRKAF